MGAGTCTWCGHRKGVPFSVEIGMRMEELRKKQHEVGHTIRTQFLTDKENVQVTN